MEPNRLKQLRKKQILFFNGIMVAVLVAMVSVIVGLEPSVTDVYRVLGIGMIAAVLLEFGMKKRPKRYQFFVGPSFMQELAAYEREKLGKKQDRNSLLVRVVLQALLAAQFLFYSYTRSSKPMVVEDLAAFLKFYIPVGLVILLVLNISVVYRSYSLDRAESEEVRWHTLQMLVAGVVLGVLMLVGGGAVIALMRM